MRTTRSLPLQPLSLVIALAAGAAWAADVPGDINAVRGAKPKPPPKKPAASSPAKPRAVAKPVTKAPAAKPAPTLAVAQDGTSPFQTIGAALKKASAGARILVHGGTYREGLVLEKPVEIAPASFRDLVVLQATGAPCLTMRTDRAAVTGIELQVGPGANRPAYAVDIPQGRLTLTGCTVGSGAEACVGVRGAGANPTLRQCTLRGSGHGIVFRDGAQGTLDDCTLSRNGGRGVTVSEGARPVLKNCRIAENGAPGIGFLTNSGGVVEDCDITGNVSGNVTIQAGAGPTLRRCRIRDGKEDGVRLTENGRGILDDCDITGNAHYAALVLRGSSPTFLRCRFVGKDADALHIGEGGAGLWDGCDILKGPGAAGVAVHAQSKPTFRGCKLHGGWWGMLLASKSTAVLENCETFDTDGPGIEVGEGSQLTLTGGKFYRNPDSLVVVTGGKAELSGVEFGANRQTQIRVARSGHLNARKCTLKDSGQDGISFSDNSDGLLEGCDISGAAQMALGIHTGSNPVVRNCRLGASASATSHGLWVGEKGKGTLEDCDISGNRAHGVVTITGAEPTLRRCRIRANGGYGILAGAGGRGTLVDCEILQNGRGPVGRDGDGKPILQACRTD